MQAFYHLGVSPAQAPPAHTAPLFYLASDCLATYSVNRIDNFDPALDSHFRVGNRHALETEAWRSLQSQQVTEVVVRPFKWLKITVSNLWKAQQGMHCVLLGVPRQGCTVLCLVLWPPVMQIEEAILLWILTISPIICSKTSVILPA